MREPTARLLLARLAFVELVPSVLDPRVAEAAVAMGFATLDL